MGKAHVPQYRGGQPRPKWHSGRRKANENNVKNERAVIKSERGPLGNPTVRNKIKREPLDDPTVRIEKNSSSRCGEQGVKVSRESRGTQCDIVSEEAKRLESDNAQLNAEKNHLVRTLVKLQDELEWVSGLRRDGVDKEGIRNMLREAA